MKTILLMSASSDGYTARPNDETPWSAEEFARCNKFAHDAGNIIVGRKTYEMMLASGDFDGSIATVVLSRNPSDDVGNVHFVSSPKLALEYLASKDIGVAVIGGGIKTNSVFLHAGLIDEIILDFEPVILGNGFRLFEQQHENVKLELLDMTKFDDGVVRMHYAVVK
jgi:dihydrofolate reductase